MEDLFSHPVLSEFISRYPPQQQHQCAQALALLGVSSLHGKTVPAQRLFTRASIAAAALSEQKRSQSRTRPSPALQKSPQRRKSSRQSRGPRTDCLHSELSRVLRLTPNKLSGWNQRLYGRRSQGSLGTRQRKHGRMLQREEGLLKPQKSGRASARIGTPISSTPVKPRSTPAKEGSQKMLLNAYMAKF